MSTITLPNIRVSSDLTVKVRLKDSGVAIDWSTLNNVKASIYSDAQRALAGRCDVSIDAEDPTLLVCQYAANKPQYVGVNRIVVSAKYHGETKTYDKPAFSFVRWTGDQAGEQITIDDPDVDVEIDVEDVSSSILDEAIRAAFAGAERANDVADSLAGVEADVEAAEALRVAAEESRVEAEEDRVEAEAARVDEEAVRVSAEDARVVAENAREAAEDLREGAEDDRAAAETARETAEAARVAAEALRVSAEGSRESAEAARAAQASADHTVAAGDHTQAAADHTQAAADHTTAASDHTQAGADHTQAAADHTTAAADHTQAQADHAVMEGYDDRLDSVESEVSQLEAKVDELGASIGKDNGVVCDGTYSKNSTLFTLEEANVGDELYLERSAGDNMISFLNANNIEIEHATSYPSTKQVPVGFVKAILDYGGSASSTIKVTNKSQVEYKIAQLGEEIERNEENLSTLDENISTRIDSFIEAENGENVTAYLDKTNIDDSNPPKTTYSGWDFQYGLFSATSIGNVTYYNGDVVSNFVKVFPLAIYQYNGMLSGNRIAFYDEWKNYLVKYDNVYYGATTGFDFVVPKDAHYARFGCAKNYLNNFSIIFKGKTILTENLTGGDRYSILTKLSSDVGDVAWKSPSAYTDVKCDLTSAEDIVKNGLAVVRASANNITPCFKYVRNVGNKYSIHLKVRMPSDVHDIEEVSQILDVDKLYGSASYHKRILLKKAKTTTINTTPKYPVAKYNACIQIATGGNVSESIVPDGWSKDYLLGVDAMSIRYTGDCSNTANQDIRLSIGNGLIRLYHENSNTDIASFVLSSYNNMVELFQAMESATPTGGVLEEFEIKPLNIDKEINDIIECDVALVSSYSDGNSGTFYDSFPFYFTTKERGRVYDIEYIVDESYENNNYHNCMALIDGYPVGYNTSQADAKIINGYISITIGDPSIQNNGVEILEFSFSDKPCSVRPTIKAIGIEGLTNTINKDGIKIPLHWFTGVVNKLKKQGVEFVTMHEVREYENGSRQFPADKNYCVVKYDDSGLINIIETPDLLDAQLRNHIAPSCALMLRGNFSDERKAKMSAVQRGYDFEWHIHHVPADNLANKWVIYYDYNTWVTQFNASMEKFFDILGYYPNIWTFHACQGNYNLVRFLKNHGFNSCYAPFGDININPLTRFNAVAHYVINQSDYDSIDKMFQEHRLG